MVDQAARLERSLDRLSIALDAADDVVTVLAATTVRTLLALSRDDPHVAAMRPRAEMLLERAPPRLHGKAAVFRMLASARRRIVPDAEV